MCNRNVTYTVDLWMRNFMRKLVRLTHEGWLGRNLMKYHKTKGMIAIKTKEELPKEADRVTQQSSLNIEEKYSWMLDLEAVAYAEMGCTEVQYSIFELEALQAQEKLITE